MSFFINGKSGQKVESSNNGVNSERTGSFNACLKDLKKMASSQNRSNNFKSKHILLTEPIVTSIKNTDTSSIKLRRLTVFHTVKNIVLVNVDSAHDATDFKNNKIDLSRLEEVKDFYYNLLTVADSGKKNSKPLTIEYVNPIVSKKVTLKELIENNSDAYSNEVYIPDTIKSVFLKSGIIAKAYVLHVGGVTYIIPQTHVMTKTLYIDLVNKILNKTILGLSYVKDSLDLDKGKSEFMTSDTETYLMKKLATIYLVYAMDSSTIKNSNTLLLLPTSYTEEFQSKFH